MKRSCRYLVCAGVMLAQVQTADARNNLLTYVEHGARSAEPDSTLVAISASIDQLVEMFDPIGLFPRLEMSAHRILRVHPVRAPESSSFGWRFHPILKRRKIHKGLDYNANLGTPVRAAAPGKVIRAGTWGTYGRIVVIDHGLGVETRYAHLHRVHVKRGDFVAAGARIGRVGATGRVTGAHLHFEVRILDAAIDPKLCFKRNSSH